MGGRDLYKSIFTDPWSRNFGTRTTAPLKYSKLLKGIILCAKYFFSLPYEMADILTPTTPWPIMVMSLTLLLQPNSIAAKTNTIPLHLLTPVWQPISSKIDIKFAQDMIEDNSRGKIPGQPKK